MPAPPWVDTLIHYVFPTVGGLLGLGLSATPLPTVYALERRNRGLGTFNPLPACVFLGNSGLWLGYGLSIADPFVYLANAPAALVSLHIILHTYPLASPAARRQMERVLALGLLALLGIGGLYLFDPPSASATSQLSSSSSSSSPPHTTLPTQVNGALASLVNVLLYASPLSSLAHVLRTRDASSILLPWTFTALGCSVTWAVYGAATGQIPVVIPHAFGFLLNIVQLILRVVVFPPQGPQGKGEGKMRSSSSGSSSSSSSSSSGGSIAMTIVKPGGRKGGKKQQQQEQQQQAMKKKGTKKGGKVGGRKAPVALLAGVRRRSDEENNYHRAPRRQIEQEEEEEDEDEDEEDLEQGGSEGEEEEWDEEAGYEGKEAAVAAAAVADFESSNTQAGRDRAGRGGGREGGRGGSSSSSRVDETLFSSNDSAGAPQTMVVVVEGEEGLGPEVPTTTRGGGASSFPSSASSSSPFSVHAALNQEVAMGGWRKRGRAGLGGEGEVPRRLQRVSSSTPLCLYDSGSEEEEEEEEEKVEEGRRGGQQRRREGGEGKRGEDEEEGEDVSISF